MPGNIHEEPKCANCTKLENIELEMDFRNTLNGNQTSIPKCIYKNKLFLFFSKA